MNNRMPAELNGRPDAPDSNQALQDGSAPAEPAAGPVAAFSKAVQYALANRSVKKPNLLQNLGGLLLSLLFFFSLGLFRDTVSGIVILVAVLLFHETGHWVGMKAFKYRDIKMFFIPMFGAAVSGNETQPASLKKVIISLLGPVPGIFLGIGAGALYLKTRNPLLSDAAWSLLFLNTFNLMPVYPLDGGRVLDALLLSRHPYVELSVKLLTTLLLGWLAYASRDILFGFFAVMVLLSLRSTWACAHTAYRLRKENALEGIASAADIPVDRLEPIVAALVMKMPASQRTPGGVAALVEEVWLRVINRSMGITASILFMAAYLCFALLGIGSSMLFANLAHAIEQPQQAGLHQNAERPSPVPGEPVY